MWQNKNKALTFSFDDGVKQDIRLVEILNKYGLKGTFNLNSGFLQASGVSKKDNMLSAADIKKVYEGHEVSSHTLTHPNLTGQKEVEIIRQVEEDRLALSGLCGCEVVGMAYPCGGINNDDRVAGIIKTNTGIRYARTITSTYSFDQQENLYRFNPTVHCLDNKIFELARKFLDDKSDKDKLFYIWGHSYEFDRNGTWEEFEDLCKILCHNDAVFYGTNREVILG